jgi:hypothetical protein
MPQTLNLAIGDISFALEWQGFHGKWDIPSAYQPFIGAGQPDIRLVLHKNPPEIRSGKKIFDSPPIWSLFRYQDKSAIKIFENFEGLQRTLILPPRLDEAELFFNASGSRFMDPFFGPTLGLLMINCLARQKGVILHTCGIAQDGNGTLFAGESGAGKSTMAGMKFTLEFFSQMAATVPCYELFFKPDMNVIELIKKVSSGYR